MTHTSFPTLGKVQGSEFVFLPSGCWDQRICATVCLRLTVWTTQAGYFAYLLTILGPLRKKGFLKVVIKNFSTATTETVA